MLMLHNACIELTILSTGALSSLSPSTIGSFNLLIISLQLFTLNSFPGEAWIGCIGLYPRTTLLMWNHSMVLCVEAIRWIFFGNPFGDSPRKVAFLTCTEARGKILATDFSFFFFQKRDCHLLLVLYV